MDIVAEIGLNHDGKIEQAKKLIEAAKKSGATSVKFQIYNTDTFVSKKYAKGQYDALKQYEFQKKDWIELKKYCDKIKINFFAAAFDKFGVDILQKLKVDRFKIASGELNNYPLLEYIRNKFKIYILSTGMSTLSEIDNTIKFLNFKDITLLHCIANYPVDIKNSNVNILKTFQFLYKFKVGLSDHCKENFASFSAVALGATMIEKHFTLDNKLPGADHSISQTPLEFKNLVYGIKQIKKSLGKEYKNVLNSEVEVKKNARRSLYLNCNLKKGGKINLNMITSRRPANGISTERLYDFVNKTIKKDIKENTLLTYDLIKF